MKQIALSGQIKNRCSDIAPRYFDAIRAAGAQPHAVYCTPPFLAACLYDGLVVCGGGDPDPRLYGKTLQFPGITQINAEVDAYEFPLLRAFLDMGKPILGICRGAQSLNIALGGTLFEDMPRQLNVCHSDTVHDICISEDSFLFELFGKTFRVNSYHHQCIEKLGKGLFASAASPDGILEAFESENKRLIGVQWHPERMPQMHTVFEYFISKT